MTALLTAPRFDSDSDRDGDVDKSDVQAPARPPLRLVDGLIPAEEVQLRTSRRPSPAVRRRRALLAVLALALTALAFPLGGAGGASHATGSTLAGSGPADYTVRPGDSLWSIAERMDPSADPRPTVARLAAEIGTYQVVPGEQLVLR